MRKKEEEEDAMMRFNYLEINYIREREKRLKRREQKLYGMPIKNTLTGRKN